MRLIHTADWHLNHRMGGVDRTPHLRERVERVARICKDEQVDVLVIAGDLFSEQAEVSSRVNQVADTFRHLREQFRGFFQRGGTILGVTGNHDQDGRIRPSLALARAGMDIAEPPRRFGDRFAPGRMYLLDSAFVGRVRDEQERFDVQFALIPFPALSRILVGTETASTSAELNRPVAEAVATWIRSLPDNPGYDVNLRTLLVAHLNVTGADVNRGLLRIDERSDAVFDAAALPTGFDYIALGHVHKPQCLRNQSHIRYSGSLDRMDHGDTDPMKEVVLVDIGPDGRRGIRPIPIEPTRLVTVTVTAAQSAAEELRAQVPDPENALVRVKVAESAAEAGAAVELAIQEALPGRVTAIQWPEAAPTGNVAASWIPEGNSVAERVRGYLQTRLADDLQRDELLALAEQFLIGVGVAT